MRSACFRSCPQPFTSGTWVRGLWCTLLSIICPNCSCRQFLVSDGSFVFCCWRRFSRWQALQQRGPRSWEPGSDAELIEESYHWGFPSDEGKGHPDDSV